MRRLALVLLAAGCNSLLGIDEPTLIEDGIPDAPVANPDAGLADAPVTPPDAALADAPVTPPPDARIVDGQVPPDALPPILGQLRVYRHHEDGVDEATIAFYEVMQALVDRGDGSFDVYPGTQRGAELEIPDVPAGRYFVELRDCESGFCRSDVAVSSRRNIDLGVDATGRLGLEPVTPGTVIDFQVDGLEPWTAISDSLEIRIPNHDVALQFQNEPSEGATTFSQLFQWPANRVLARDTFFVLQRSEVVVGPMTLSAIVRSYTAPPFDMVLGMNNRIHATMSAPPTRSVSLDWRRSSFGSALPSTVCAGPSDPTSHQLSVSAMAAPSFDIGRFVPILLLFEAPEGSANIDGGQYSFGDPDPTPWGRIRRAISQRPCQVTTSTGTTLRASAYVTAQVDIAGSPGPIQPIIGPPRSPEIDGVAASGDLPGIDPTPLVEWSAPSFGTPNRYVVELYRLLSDSARLRARITVPAGAGPRARLLPGMIEDGGLYVIVIHAVATGTDPEAQPFRMSFPYGAAAALTGRLSTGAIP